MDKGILLVMGAFISITGLINISGNISTIHSYNRRKVREEDIPKYGKAVGTGTLIIGISMIIAFVLSLLDQVILLSYVILAGIVLGLGFILYAQFKYNKGIF